MPNQPEPTSGSGRGEMPIGYEQAREELTSIVARLETGGTTLEDALTLWERGEYLAGVCAQWLDRAEQRLRGDQTT